MSKREASILGGGGIDIDAPRAKRRKEAASSSPPKEHANGTSAAASASYDAVGATGATVKEDPGEVRERGLKLWHIVKDAVNKECVTNSLQRRCLVLIRLPHPMRPHHHFLPTTLAQ